LNFKNIFITFFTLKEEFKNYSRNSAKNVKFNQNNFSSINKLNGNTEICNSSNPVNTSSKFEDSLKENEFSRKIIQSNSKFISSKNEFDNYNNAEHYISGEEKITVL
jgi:hypothetical protein